jgi:hypothetical protein
VKGNYMVAVCDILGFAELVETQPLDDVVNSALGWFRQSLHHSLHKDGFPDSTPELQELESHTDIGVAWFSDTVLLHTLRDDDACVQNLLSTVCWLLFETIVSGRTRIRSGISYGEAYIDTSNPLYVGTPIIDAYRLQQSQQWSGAALSKSAEARIPVNARSGRSADWWITPYSVPLKRDSQVMLAVNWTRGLHHPAWKQVWSESQEEPSEQEWKEKRDVCEKFVNTKTFHDLTCPRCRKARETVL